ncbi:MAG: hypothetical protein HY924_14505 [Elusimicrobia bacterium]|nr:hypothetical protein [Elusimicrobiota bacterium]
MKTGLAGRASAQGGSLVCVGLILGLLGVTWTLPSKERMAAVLPPGADTPALHQRLTESWAGMHRKLGINLMLNPEAMWRLPGVQSCAPGWTSPPDLLLNPIRSFFVRSGHDDEQSFLIVLSRMKPRQLDFHPHMFIYGGAHVYTLGAGLAAGAALGLVELHRGLAPYMAEPSRMAALYLPGRLLSVLAYLGCGLMLLRLGRRRFDLGVGWLAGLLFLCSPASVVQAHVLKHAAFWTFFGLWSFERSAEVLAAGRLRDYALAGLAAGLAMGTSLGAWPVCSFAAAAACMRVWDGEKPGAELRGLVLAGSTALLAFFATNPYWLIDHSEALKEYAVIKSANAGLSWTHPFVFLAEPLRHAVTLPFLAFIGLGTLFAVAGARTERTLAFAALCFWLGAASVATFSTVSPARAMRYYLVWMGLGLLLAARAAAGPGPWKRARLALAGLAALNLMLEGLTYSYNFRLAASAESNQFRAGRWISANVPPGEKVGFLRLPAPSNSPYFRFDRYELTFVEEGLFKSLPPEKLPRWMVVAIPDYDDRPNMEPNLSRYERAAAFDRPKLVPWIRVHPTATTANPVFEIYKLKS